MPFVHAPPDISIPSLKEEMVGNSRFYVTPNGKKYPSVTTVLSDDEKTKKSLNEWRKRVGQEEAKKISAEATKFGTSIHSILEDYINNHPLGDRLMNVSQKEKIAFAKMGMLLDSNLNHVALQEATLYSDSLMLAGRVDLIANWKNQLSIVDFKTSKKEKKEEWIQKYFLQATAYSIMWRELTGIDIGNIVILIVCHEENPMKVQVFEKNPKEYEKLLLETVDLYHHKFQ